MKPRRVFRRPLALLSVVALAAVLTLGAGAPASRAADAGSWANLSAQDRNDLAPFLQSWQYITHDFAGSPDRSRLVNAAIRGMVSQLGDPHSAYFLPQSATSFTNSLSGKYDGIGVRITGDANGLRLVDVFQGSPAERAGLKPDDVITAVNGVDMQGVSLDAAASIMRGQPGTVVTLKVLRGEGADATRLTVQVARAELELPSVTTRMLVDGVAYVKVDQFNANTGDQFVAAYRQLRKQGIRALVLDLRGNPGGYVNAAVELAGVMLPGQPVVRIIDAHGVETDLTYTDVSTPADSEQAPGSGSGVSEGAGGAGAGAVTDLSMKGITVAILVDGNTASAAEIVSGALQDNGAVLVGHKTYGKGSVQSLLGLVNGATLKLTTAHYHTPKGRKIDHIGLTPDIDMSRVQPSPADLGSMGSLTLVPQQVGLRVTALQARLRYLGYTDADPRGRFLDGTQRALWQFEADHQLARSDQATPAVLQAVAGAVAQQWGTAARHDATVEAALDYVLSGQLPQ